MNTYLAMFFDDARPLMFQTIRAINDQIAVSKARSQFAMSETRTQYEVWHVERLVCREKREPSNAGVIA
jgi:hypothetical protein